MEAADPDPLTGGVGGVDMTAGCDITAQKVLNRRTEIVSRQQVLLIYE